MNGRDTRQQDDSAELLRQQRVLAKFGELALRSEDLNDILTEACRLVSEALGTDLAEAVELQPDGRTLLVRAGVGWKPGVVGQVRLQLDEQSPESHAINTGEAVISADIGAETRFRYPDFLVENGVKAIVNVIILGTEGRPPFGILQVDSRQPRCFTETDITFLRSYANLLAAAVGRLRAIDELREVNQSLERRVEERTRARRDTDRRLRAEATEHERAQAALREAHRMELVVEHLPIGAGLFAPSGQVIFGNPEFRRLLPQPSIPSTDPEAGGEWRGFDAEGRPVDRRDHPAARALQGEMVLNMDFLHRSEAVGERWRRVSSIPVHGPDNAVVAALVVILDVDEEKRATERQMLLAREVNHWARNMLSVMQAALRLTRAESVDGFVQVIGGRMAALARAQTLLVADRWSGADLQALLRGEFAAFLEMNGTGPQVTLEGPLVALPAGAAQPFAMAIHELATNAIKYGALSTPAGHVSLRWQEGPEAGGVLRLRWTETGGPPPQGPPQRQGFGSRVLRGTLRDLLGGRIAMAWPPEGLVCDIEIPRHRQPPPGEAEAAPENGMG